MLVEIQFKTISISFLLLLVLQVLFSKYFLAYFTNLFSLKKIEHSKSDLKELFTTTAFDKKNPYAILVGVGPGDTSLLTIAALKVLSEADLVLSDRLVSKSILELLHNINPKCEVRIASKCKKRSNSTIVQNQLNDWIVEGMDRNLRVCRLKGGDPFVFGRGMEEIESVIKRGYRIKVIPGISSSMTAPLAAGISVTKRNSANKLMIATAHGQFDTFPDMPGFRSDCTLVFLMGVSRLSLVMKELLSKGFRNDVPVCVIERATTEQQRKVIGTIETIAELCIKEMIKPPATIIVGDVCINKELEEGYKTYYLNGGVIFSPSS